MNEPEKLKRRWGKLQWGVVLSIALLLVFVMVPVIYNVVIDRAYRARQARNGKSIILSLKVFAQDCGSRYPDGFQNRHVTANSVFRTLIHDEIVGDERVFDGLISPYFGDGRIGSSPDFLQAVEPGENHWMMLGEMTTMDESQHPLIFENALDSKWPPRWKPASSNRIMRGRTWRGDQVLVGLNDGSVTAVKTRLIDELVTLPESMLHGLDGKPWTKIRVLDIEERRISPQ